METFIQETMLEDTSICDQLIEYHKNNMEYKNPGKTTGSGGGKISTDVTAFIGGRNPIIHMYLEQVMKAVALYLKTYDLEKMFTITLREAFNIQHYKPNEGFLGWHCERSQTQTNQRALVFMTYLKPVKGKMVMWPTDFTHTHRGITSPTQEKYIATGWYNFMDFMETHKNYQQHLQQLSNKK